LAKEFKIDRAAITRKISPNVTNIKTLANQIVSVDAALKQLPITQQIATLNLVDELKAMSTNLASAGKFGALNANRLMGIAHNQLNKVNVNDPMKSLNEIKAAISLTDAANESSKIAMGLINANKEQVQRLSEPEVESVKGLESFYGK
jgi:hypothetical protein